MKLNWRDPRKEKPKVGQKIWLVDVHWKQEFPESYEIHGAEYCGINKLEGEDKDNYCYGAFGFADNIDYFGQGSQTWVFPPPYMKSLAKGMDEQTVCAWIPAEELELPDFLEPEKRE